MFRKQFSAAFLIVFITAGFFKVAEIQAETTRFSSEPSRTFNPFNMNSWFSIPAQFVQYWFPYFQQPYYPSYLQRPATTTTPPTTIKDQTLPERPKTDNIFGISGPPDEDVEYLPPGNEIEW